KAVSRDFEFTSVSPAKAKKIVKNINEDENLKDFASTVAAGAAETKRKKKRSKKNRKKNKTAVDAASIPVEEITKDIAQHTETVNVGAVEKTDTAIKENHIANSESFGNDCFSKLQRTAKAMEARMFHHISEARRINASLVSTTSGTSTNPPLRYLKLTYYLQFKHTLLLM